MINDSGCYFLSKNFLLSVSESKKQGVPNPSSLLLYILVERALRLGKNINFFCTQDTLRELKEKWKDLETIPAISKLIAGISSSPAYIKPGEILLDAVSDVAVFNSPDYTCLLVSQDEFENVTNLKEELSFIGFKIFTPEAILEKEGLYPLKSNFMGKIKDLTCE